MYNDIDTYYVCIRQYTDTQDKNFICKEFETPGEAASYTINNTSYFSESKLIPMCKFTPQFIRKFLIDRSLTKTFIKSKIE